MSISAPAPISEGKAETQRQESFDEILNLNALDLQTAQNSEFSEHLPTLIADDPNLPDNSDREHPRLVFAGSLEMLPPPFATFEVPFSSGTQKDLR